MIKVENKTFKADMWGFELMTEFMENPTNGDNEPVSLCHDNFK
jgi:hypothetical protein